MSIKFLNKIVTVSALMSSAGAMEEHATLDQLPVEIKQKNQRVWIYGILAIIFSR